MRHKPRRHDAFRECARSRVDAYEAYQRPPYCNNGRGCSACWAKFFQENPHGVPGIRFTPDDRRPERRPEMKR